MSQATVSFDRRSVRMMKSGVTDQELNVEHAYRYIGNVNCTMFDVNGKKRRIPAGRLKTPDQQELIVLVDGRAFGGAHNMKNLAGQGFVKFTVKNIEELLDERRFRIVGFIPTSSTETAIAPPAKPRGRDTEL